jgi:hypothetical protein
MTINAGWHLRNRMPRNASIDDRIRWHVAHARACACRPIPESVAREIRTRSRRPAASRSRAARVAVRTAPRRAT